ncbi:hypothetical protein LFYK43_11020 [Ligilactobacillus salitolerans]|uniref:Phage head-tail connector protein n=1 Tax=Ligilactobacillus salitolerans TaxID=1808352 RepID=A0A401ISX0_9LACO|nr:phage head-tail connector protein [Ligilactobacillus salitolerans]GBG94643.1 hypothetical protein LFYK43_11020 [Ligilactobacillus salitolerans]
MELTDLKTMLQIKDNSRDSILNLISKNTESALCFKLGEKKVPDELSYIALEVAVKRYNRIANEGMSSYSQEGESITFSTNDFDEFTDDIADWKNDNGLVDDKAGRFLFL